MAASRRRGRLIFWSLLAVFLVGLGLMLNAKLSPRPRCVIPLPDRFTRIHLLDDEGRTILTKRISSTAEVSGPIKTWDTKTGQNLGTFLSNDAILASFISPDGRFCAVLDSWGLLHLIDLKQGREFKDLLQVPSNRPREFIFSPHGNFLAVRIGYLVRIFEWNSGKVTYSEFENLTFFRFLPDENVLMSQEGNLVLWDPRTGETTQRFEDIDPLELSPNGKTLLAYSADQGLVLFNTGTQKAKALEPPITLPLPFFALKEIRSQFSPDSKMLVLFPVLNNQITVWDVASGKRLSADEWERVPGKVLFSPDSSLFLQGGTLRNSTTGRTLWKRDGLNIAPTRVVVVCLWCNAGMARFTPDGQFLCWPDAEKGLQLIDARSGQTKTIIPFGAQSSPFEREEFVEVCQNGSCYSMREMSDPSPSPSMWQRLFGRWWPTSKNSDDMQVTVFQTSTGRILGQLQGPYGNGHLSNDGRTMVTAYREQDGSYSLRCWDLPLRPPLRLVVGIPLGIGLFFVLVSWWRSPRRAARLKTSPSPG